MPGSTDNVVSLLSSINGTLQGIARSLAGQNGKAGEETISKLHRGGVDTAGSAASATKSNALGIGDISSFTGTIRQLEGLPKIIKDIAKISNATMLKFNRVIDSLVDSMTNAVEFGKKHKDAAKDLKELTSAVSSMKTMTMDLVKLVPLAPIALVGTLLIAPVLLALGGVLSILGKFKGINRAMRVLRQINGGFMDGLLKMTLSMMLLSGTAISLGIIITKYRDVAVAGIVGVIGIMVLMIGLITITAIVSMLNDATDGVASMLKVMGVMFAGIALILVAGLMGKYMTANADDIMRGIGGVVSIMGACMVMSMVARAGGSEALAGTKAMAVIGGLLFGAFGLMYLAGRMAGYIKGHADDILTSLGSAALMVLAVGAIAAAVSTVSEFVIMGAAALGAVELVIAGMMGDVALVINLRKKREESGYKWIDLLGEMAGVVSIMAAVGSMSGAVALASVPALLAVPAMAAITLVITSAFAVVTTMAGIRGMIKLMGGIEPIQSMMENDIPKLLKTVNRDNFKPGMNLIQMAATTAEFVAMDALLASFLVACLAIGKIAKFGQMVDGQGRISPIISYDKVTREAVFGKPVDIKVVASSVVGAVKAFVEKCTFGIEDVEKMKASKRIFRMLGRITGPITSFVDMLTSFVSDGEGRLAPVRISEDGKITTGEFIDVEEVAGSIISSVDIFVNSMYSDENVARWSDRSNRRAARKARRGAKKTYGALEAVIAPISDFIDLMAGLVSSDGKLHKAEYDEEGNLKIGEPIDIDKTSGALVSGVNGFMDAVFSDANITKWGDNVKKGDKIFDNIDSAITKITSAFANNSMSKAVSNGDSLSKTMELMAVKVKELDDVIIGNDAKRVGAIKRMGDAFAETADKFNGAQDKFDSMLRVLSDLNNINAENINAELQKIDATKLEQYGNITTRMMDENTITTGFKNAMNGTSISIDWDMPATQDDPEANMYAVASGGVMKVSTN